MRIHDFTGADFEPVSKLLGICRHAEHGDRSYWYGADELCVGLSKSDHGFVAQDSDGMPVGVVLVESACESNHNRDLRMHWLQQRTVLSAVCRSLGISVRGSEAHEGACEGGAILDGVVLLVVADGATREQVERKLLQAALTWLGEHGYDVAAQPADDAVPKVLPNDAAHDEAVGDLLNMHAQRHGVDFVQYNYHVEEDGELVAGIVAWSLGPDVHIDMLAVREENRRKGLGSLLLSHVEEQARAAGCTTASVDTFSFQAPEFYPAHGYEVVFRYPLDDGTERIYFSKRLQ